MTQEQKTYIENNVELIDNNNWDKFFKHAPHGTGTVLYEAGINFLKDIRYVPGSAFYESNIQTIDIPNNIRIIGNHAFQDCSSLTSITIPDSVTMIGPYAFCGCSSLKSIVILNNVMIIYDKAFSDCGELEINYNGTVLEWKNLIVDSRKVFSQSIYTCNCIDGIVRN